MLELNSNNPEERFYRILSLDKLALDCDVFAAVVLVAVGAL